MPTIQQQLPFGSSHGPRGGNYNNGDRTVKVLGSTPHSRSPINTPGNRPYAEPQQPRAYYERRDSIGVRRDSATEWDDPDYTGQGQYSGHRDSASRQVQGQGLGVGFLETDLM